MALNLDFLSEPKYPVEDLYFAEAPERLSVTQATVPTVLYGSWSEKPSAARTEPSREPSDYPAPNILLLDIETRPHLAYIWGMWQQNITPDLMVTPSSMICFAAQWLDSDENIFYSSFHNGKEMMVREAHRLLSAADIVITYNGDRFDLPNLNTEMLLLGLTPPAPYKSIDLWKTMKRKFSLPSNKLGNVLKSLSLQEKEPTGGFDTWLGCMRDDPAAWAAMKAYNIGDVRTLKQLYLKVRPWVESHPSLSAISQNFTCPRCGSGDVQRRGFSHTKVGKFQRFICKNCGGWSRNSKRVSGTTIVEAL